MWERAGSLSTAHRTSRHACVTPPHTPTRHSPAPPQTPTTVLYPSHPLARLPCHIQDESAKQWVAELQTQASAPPGTTSNALNPSLCCPATPHTHRMKVPSSGVQSCVSLGTCRWHLQPCRRQQQGLCRAPRRQDPPGVALGGGAWGERGCVTKPEAGSLRGCQHGGRRGGGRKGIGMVIVLLLARSTSAAHQLQLR